MAVLVALDQGTTSSRTMVFAEDGRVLARAQAEFPQHFPKPGWVEHDPEQIWTSQRDTLRAALAQAGVGPADVAAVGIANQRETTVLWERRTGRPVAPALVWQDRRTAEHCERLARDGLLDLVRRRTGLLLDPYFSGTKLAWLLEHVPDARRRAEAGELAFGTVDSWLAYRLSDGALHVTDPSNASRTLLFDIQKGAWDQDLCQALGVPEAVLPRVVSTSGVCGELDGQSGLPGVPLAALVGDQQGALFGQLCHAPGLVKNTYGTGCFLLGCTGAQAIPAPPGLLTTVAWKLADAPTTFALEGAVFIGGAVVQWLRDGLGLIASSAEVESLAASVSDDGGVVFVPAFAGLGAPHWDPFARGALLGLTRGTQAGHVARAALQGIAFQVADLLAAMESGLGAPLSELRVDGGAAANDLLMQMQADLLGVPVERPALLETTAFGAALLAGLGVGLWKDTAGFTARRVVDRRFEPSLPAEQVARLHARWKRATERVAGWSREQDDPA